MNRPIVFICRAIVLAVLGACASHTVPEAASYSATSAELGLGGSDRAWEAERHAAESLMQVAKSGWPGPMPLSPDGFEMQAFADLAWQRGFLGFEVQRERIVESQLDASPKQWVTEYVVAFSNRDVVAEQPTYPLNSNLRGSAKQASRLAVAAGAEADSSGGGR